MAIPAAVLRSSAMPVPADDTGPASAVNLNSPDTVMPPALSASSLAQRQALARTRIELIDFAMMHYQAKIAPREVECQSHDVTSSILTLSQMNS